MPALHAGIFVCKLLLNHLSANLIIYSKILLSLFLLFLKKTIYLHFPSNHHTLLKNEKIIFLFHFNGCLYRRGQFNGSRVGCGQITRSILWNFSVCMGSHLRRYLAGFNVWLFCRRYSLFKILLGKKTPSRIIYRFLFYLLNSCFSQLFFTKIIPTSCSTWFHFRTNLLRFSAPFFSGTFLSPNDSILFT